MSLQTATATMISHELSTVHGSYVVIFEGAPVFVTSDIKALFENLEPVAYADAHKVRVLLVSSEDWSQDDITALVWDEMVERYAGGGITPTTCDQWDECIGSNIGFIRFGFDEFNPNQERAKRREERAARDSRASAWLAGEAPFAVAAE